MLHQSKSRNKSSGGRVEFPRGHEQRAASNVMSVSSIQFIDESKTHCSFISLFLFLCFFSSPPVPLLLPSFFSSQSSFLFSPTTRFPWKLKPNPNPKFTAFAFSLVLLPLAEEPRRVELQGLMGNCLDSSAKVDAAQSSRTTSGNSRLVLHSSISSHFP